MTCNLFVVILWLTVMNLLQSAYTEIHFNYLDSGSSYNLIDLNQKFLHKQWCSSCNQVSRVTKRWVELFGADLWVQIDSEISMCWQSVSIFEPFILLIFHAHSVVWISFDPGYEFLYYKSLYQNSELQLWWGCINSLSGINEYIINP